MWSARLTSAQFCGVLGAVAVWVTPLLADRVEARDDECLLTHEEVLRLRHAVLADDGRVYDAWALRDWMRRCRGSGRSTCVIPEQPIGVVKPVRLVAARWRTAATQTDWASPPRPARGTPPTSAGVARGTARAPPAAAEVGGRPGGGRPRGPRATIPSSRSAFSPVVAQRV